MSTSSALVRTGFVIAGLCVSLIAVLPAHAETLTIDGVHSTVMFRIKHLKTSFSWGRFDDVAGKLVLDGEKPTVNVQIKADSIDTANVKRDEHLKGPDFFNVKQFPTISFKSTRVAPSGPSSYDVEGVLSLHGVERPIKVVLARTGAGKNQVGAPITGFESTFAIKRSEFGMKFLLEGLSDDVQLVVALECAGK